MKFILAVTSVLFAGFLAGCAGSGERADMELKAELPEFHASAVVTESWSAEVGAGSQWLALGPWADNRAVYVADAEGHISAWALNSGKRLWKTDVDAAISGGVGGGNGMLLLGTTKGQLLALRAETGAMLWRAAVTSEILAPPSAGNGVAVAQTGDGKVSGYAAADGKRLWVQERTEPSLTLHGTSSPVIVDNKVLCGFSNGRLTAFNLNDGRQLWELALAEPRGRNEIERLVDVDAQPVVMGRTVFSVAYQGRLVASSIDNGTILWSRDLSAYAGMAHDDSNLYVTDARGDVLALDAASGGVVWKQDRLYGRGLTAPVAMGKYVVVGDSDGYFHFMRREDGALAARYKISEDVAYENALTAVPEAGISAIRSRAVVVGDTLYALNAAGRLAALRIR